MSPHKYTFLLLVFIYLSMVTESEAYETFLTYKLSGGRFGDNLTAAIRCETLSHIYDDIPVLHPSFRHADKLVLSQTTTRLTSHMKRKLKHKTIKETTTELAHPQNNTLYYVNYIGKLSVRENLVTSCWQDKNLLKKVKQLIQPITPIKQLSIPKGKITIAIHIRKGCKTDAPLLSEQIYRTSNKLDADKAYPMKFPPEQYYIDQIQLLSELLGNTELYIYIFTDYANPQELVKRFRTIINNNNIMFGYKNKHNCSDPSSIFHDFFGMGQFNILIRPDSNLSLCAQIVGNNIIGIRPDSYHWEKNRLIIDTSIATVRMGDLVKHYSLPAQKYMLKQELQQTKILPLIGKNRE